MIHYHRLGMVPEKHHITLRDENDKLMMEQCVTTKGFLGAYSILYYRDQPIAEATIPEDFPLPEYAPATPVATQRPQRRHIRTQDVPVGGDFVSARKTLLVNKDVHIGVIKPDAAPQHFFTNGDGDELFFMHRGSGTLESIYGTLDFRQQDYVLIPKGTPYRFHFKDNTAVVLCFEGKPHLGVPKEFRNETGQLSMFAPYCHRDFRIPQELVQYDAAKHGSGAFKLITKRNDRLTLHTYDKWPFDVVGWDGNLYPVAFNIRDYQPKTGLVHLPPTVHTTFAGNGFVVCSFVPRKVDYHERSIPCPYGHSSVDMDEILYYVEGNFTSRKGIDEESISLHPQGLPHGPHPGTYEASIGTTETNEMAVMCDTYDLLRMTPYAASIEDPDYHTSWIEHEG